MSEKKQCLVCNNLFEPCYTCEQLGLISWRNIVCCREHGILNNIVANYLRKFETKEKCKQDLLEYISEFGDTVFNDNVQPVIEEIMREDKVVDTRQMKITKTTKKAK